MSDERVGWWLVGTLRIYGGHAWAQGVANFLDRDLTPVFPSV